MPTAMLILAEGAEEMEAVIAVDVMRRGGIDVTVAGLTGDTPVLCSRNVQVKPDVTLDSVKSTKFDAVVLPGGAKGAENLAKSNTVGELLKTQESDGRIVAAICAAPIALKSHGIGKSKNLTSHPGVKSVMEEGGIYSYKEDRVVVDGKLITSRGPGTAFEFGLALVEALQGKEKKDSIVPPMLIKL